MKTTSLFFIFAFVPLLSFSNTEFQLPYDTTEIYVINKTNHLVGIQHEAQTSYTFFYRDLSTMKSNLREILFEDAASLIKFFDTCEKSLETDKTYITDGYNIYRNKLNKKFVRINDKEGGYVMIKKDDLELMRAAFENSLK